MFRYILIALHVTLMMAAPAAAGIDPVIDGVPLPSAEESAISLQQGCEE